MTPAINDILDEIDAVLEENENTSPYASTEEFTDATFLKTIELIRTRSANLYGISRDSVNPYESWVQLLKFFQDNSWTRLWLDPEETEFDEDDADDYSIDFEKYSLFLEEMMFQMMYDISILARGNIVYGSNIAPSINDGFTNNLSGAGVSKLVAMHIFDFDPTEAPLVSQVSSNYELERITSIFPYLSPSMQGTVQRYMDVVIPKVFPNRAL